MSMPESNTRCLPRSEARAGNIQGPIFTPIVKIDYHSVRSLLCLARFRVYALAGGDRDIREPQKDSMCRFVSVRVRSMPTHILC